MLVSTNAKTTQSDPDTSNDMSCEDVCAIAWKVYKAGKGAGKKGPNGSGTWHRGKGADELTSGRRDNGAKKGDKKGSKAANRIGTVTRTKEAREKARARAKARVKPDTATTAESRTTSE